jgi:hypothetical protein
MSCFAQDKRLPEILEDVAWLGAMLLEAEITEFLGRHRYPRRRRYKVSGPTKQDVMRR